MFCGVQQLRSEKTSFENHSAPAHLFRTLDSTGLRRLLLRGRLQPVASARCLEGERSLWQWLLSDDTGSIQTLASDLYGFGVFSKELSKDNVVCSVDFAMACTFRPRIKLDFFYLMSPKDGFLDKKNMFRQKFICGRGLNVHNQAEIISTAWNYIYDDETKLCWVELREFSLGSPQPEPSVPQQQCVCGVSTVCVGSPQPEPSVPQQQRVCGVSTALRLVRNRKVHKICSLNVYGEVRTVSEVFSYKKRKMMFVEMKQGPSILTILIQKEEFLHWQLLIESRWHYVITNLRPTSAFKGSSNEMALCVPTSGSEVTRVDASFKPDLLETPSEEECEEMRDSEGSAQREADFSYSGVITGTKDRHFLAFELDDKVALYLNGTGAVHNFAMLRVGMHVTVLNVHPRKLAGQFCCIGCVRTSVVITSVPDSIVSESNMEIEEHGENGINGHFSTSSESINRMKNVMQCNVRIGDLLSEKWTALCNTWLIRTNTTLLRKLSPTIVRTDDIIILLRKLAEWRGLDQVDTKHLDIPSVLSATHHDPCPFAAESTTDTSSLPSISEVLVAAQRQFLTPEHGEGDGEAMDGSSAYWSYRSASLPGVLLLGQLTVNKKTACLQLVDRTEGLDVVCVSRSGHDPLTDNLCHCLGQTSPQAAPTQEESNAPNGVHRNMVCGNHSDHDRSQCDCLEQISLQSATTQKESANNGASNEMCQNMYMPCTVHPGCVIHRGICEEKRTCDFVHCHDLSSLIVVEKFQLVVERFLVSGSVRSRHDSNNQAQFIYKCYAVFVMHDITKLTDPSNILPLFYPTLPSRTISEGNSSSQNIVGKPDKLPNMLQNMCALNDTGPDYAVIQRILVLSKDALTVQWFGGKAPARLKFHCSVLFLGSACVTQVTENEVHVPCTENDQAAEGREAMLLFEGRATQWYHVLHPGSAYLLMKPGCRDTSHFQPKYSSSLVKRGAEKSNARCAVILSDDVIVRETTLTDQDDVTVKLRETNKLHVFTPIRHFAENRSDSKLLSVVGALLDRTHYEDQFSNQRSAAEAAHLLNLGVSLPGGMTVRLRLADPHLPSRTLHVYMSCSNVSVPTGLVPGALLACYKLDARRSAKGKRYCYLTSVSAVRVLAWDRMPSVEDIRGGQRNTAVCATGMANEIRVPSLLLDIEKSGGISGHESSSRASRPSRVLITVLRVLKLQLCNMCAICRQIVVTTASTSGVSACACAVSRPCMKAKASIMVEDGTGKAWVQCEDRLVFRLLNLTNSETEALTDLSSRFGQICYASDDADSMDPVSLFLRMLCTSTTVCRRLHMMVQTFSRKSPNWHTIQLKDLKLRNEGSGEHRFETMTVPLMLLECLHIEELEPARTAAAFLYL